MKALIVLGLVCFALTNAFVLPTFSAEDLALLQSAQVGTTEVDDFNENDALEAFLKGVLKGVNAGDATDSALCLTGTGPSLLLEYYYGLTLAVSNAGQATALDAANNYLSTIGARQIRKLPADFTQCLANSNDYQLVQAKLKIDPQSAQFNAGFAKYVGQNPQHFKTTFDAAYSKFVSGDFVGAGKALGGLAQVVAIGINRNTI